jgi:hypothetical protein
MDSGVTWTLNKTEENAAEKIELRVKLPNKPLLSKLAVKVLSGN